MSTQFPSRKSVDSESCKPIEQRSATEHFVRARELSVPANEREKVAKRFWAKVSIPRGDACWPWKNGRKQKGYGRFEYKGKTVQAHRMAYALNVETVPLGMCVLHRCDKPHCCNPAHLFLGTDQENVSDMVLKGRQARRERHGRSKLTSDAVSRIRSSNAPLEVLADIYGVHVSVISSIRLGKHWKPDGEASWLSTSVSLPSAQKTLERPAAAIVDVLANTSLSVRPDQDPQREKAIELDNSRSLFMHHWSDSRTFYALCEYLDQFLFADKRRNYVKSWQRQLRIVIADIFCRYCEDPSGYLRVSLDKNWYRTANRYSRMTLTYPIATETLYKLRDRNFLTWHNGYSNGRKGRRRQTRIRASNELIELFDKFALRFEDFQNAPHEVILLKGTNGELIDYEDDDFTRRMRTELDQYNAFIENTYIDLDLNGYVEPVGEKVLTVNLAAKRSHRVFNNGDRTNKLSWLEGGRFFGAWWVNIPRALRQRIKINAERTIEIDFSAIHPVLLYAREGIDYFGEGDQDPYAFELTIAGLSATQIREAAKKLFLAAVNASSQAEAIQGVQHEFLSPRNRPFREVIRHLPSILNAIVGKHSRIAHLLCSGIGLELQNEDACIAERVIRAFVKQRRPILCIHDSFVVQHKDAEFLRAEMSRALVGHGWEDHGIELTTKYKDKLFHSANDRSHITDDGFVTDDLSVLLKGMDVDQLLRFEAFAAGNKRQGILRPRSLTKNGDVG